LQRETHRNHPGLAPWPGAKLTNISPCSTTVERSPRSIHPLGLSSIASFREAGLLSSFLWRLTACHAVIGLLSVADVLETEDILCYCSTEISHFHDCPFHQLTAPMTNTTIHPSRVKSFNTCSHSHGPFFAPWPAPTILNPCISSSPMIKTMKGF